MDCKYLEFKNHDRTVYSSNSLHTFHQNIRGLRSKTDKLINSLEIDNINPHVLYFSEHHMEEQGVLHLTLPGYILRSSCYRQNLRKGGVCIFFRIDLYFSKINISTKGYGNVCHSTETKSSKLIISSLYTVPTGDFNQCIKKNLIDTLKHLYKPKTEFLIRGDINTYYLKETNRTKLLASLLTYNLLHTLNFATIIQNNLSTAIDNIFVDNSRLNLSSISATINGLSDKNAQILTITTIYPTISVRFDPLLFRTDGVGSMKK